MTRSSNNVKVKVTGVYANSSNTIKIKSKKEIPSIFEKNPPPPPL